MTRSDIALEIAKLHKMTDKEKTNLIYLLRHKIEEVYTIVIELETDKRFNELGALLRKALES